MTRGIFLCPDSANHQPHPSGYVAHSGWAGKALQVADQAECSGCGRWEIWVPKRPDLRIGSDWLAGCDGGACNAECVGERYVPVLNRWVPVCAEHAEVKPR